MQRQVVAEMLAPMEHPAALQKTGDLPRRQLRPAPRSAPLVRSRYICTIVVGVRPIITLCCMVPSSCRGARPHNSKRCRLQKSWSNLEPFTRFPSSQPRSPLAKGGCLVNTEYTGTDSLAMFWKMASSASGRHYLDPQAGFRSAAATSHHKF